MLSWFFPSFLLYKYRINTNLAQINLLPPKTENGSLMYSICGFLRAIYEKYYKSNSCIGLRCVAILNEFTDGNDIVNALAGPTGYIASANNTIVKIDWNRWSAIVEIESGMSGWRPYFYYRGLITTNGVTQEDSVLQFLREIWRVNQ